MVTPPEPGDGGEGSGGGEAPPGAGGPDPWDDPGLVRLRDRISRLDDELIRLMGERRELVLAVGRLKRELGLPVLDPPREARVVRKAAARARALGVDEEMTRDVLWRIIASARAEQEGRPLGWPERTPEKPEETDEDPVG